MKDLYRLFLPLALLASILNAATRAASYRIYTSSAGHQYARAADDDYAAFRNVSSETAADAIKMRK